MPDVTNGPSDELRSMTRREWDLAEKVAELDTRLAAAIEATTLREIEIRSLRQELELRMTYNKHLEELAEERLREVEWLRRSLDASRLGHLADMSVEDARLALIAERQRLSYRAVQLLTRYRKVFGAVKRLGREFVRSDR